MKQPWIRSAPFDLAWVLLPIIAPALLVMAMPRYFAAYNTGLGTGWWVLLVLLIDVSHVYSTLYRTYFSKTGLQKYSTVLRVIPLASFIVGVLLYSISPMLFWRCIAYLAVFHFIRQQYGFMRIYSRFDKLPAALRIINTITIYSVALVPILIWHCMGQRNFNWFVEDDFLYLDIPWLAVVLKLALLIIVIAYLLGEVIAYRRYGIFNLARLLLVLGTALSWYIGIVAFNGDLVFTLLNVLAHGIPYMALIWAAEKRNGEAARSGLMKHVFKSYGLALFVGSLILFAYLEEGLWDAMVWREHGSLFSGFYFMGEVTARKALAFLVPLLSLPQVVHYVLDGFIWKLDKGAPGV